MVTEEFVTKKVITWLEKKGWLIVCFDFPQSGTGFALRPKESKSKNKDIIIPDIVAVKKSSGLLFENKDRFFIGDFKKIEKLKLTSDYSESLQVLFNGKVPPKMHYGIAFPHFSYQINKANPFLKKIDFLLTVSNTGEINIQYNPHCIEFHG